VAILCDLGADWLTDLLAVTKKVIHKITDSFLPTRSSSEKQLYVSNTAKAKPVEKFRNGINFKHANKLRTKKWTQATKNQRADVSGQSYDASATARCVMDSPALWTQHAVCAVKFVKSFATWQHRFDVDSNFLSYLLPCPWYNFTQNVISSSV